MHVHHADVVDVLTLTTPFSQTTMASKKDVKALTTQPKKKSGGIVSNPSIEKNRRRQLHAKIANDLGLEAKLDTGNSRLYVGTIDALNLSDNLVKTIQELDLPRHHPIKVFNAICHPARDCQFFSDDAKHYSFARSKAEAKPLTSELLVLLNNVNTKFQDRYNGILVNRYTKLTDNINAHSDDERELGDSGVVAIVFGANRMFRIIRKYRGDDGKLKTKKELEISLPNGSLVWMEGDFQKEFKHEVPALKGEDGVRISFTFRVHR